MCPGNHESGGKRRSGRARKGNAALRAALCEARLGSLPQPDPATYPPSTATCCAPSGKKGQTRAIFAVGHSILVIAWHLLANNSDLRATSAVITSPAHNDTEARKRYLVRQLEALGHKVTVEPAAA